MTSEANQIAIICKISVYKDNKVHEVIENHMLISHCPSHRRSTGPLPSFYSSSVDQHELVLERFLKQVQVRSRSHWFNVHMSDIVELQMYHSNYVCYACYFFTKKSYKNRVQPWQSIRLSPTEGGLPIMIIK